MKGSIAEVICSCQDILLVHCRIGFGLSPKGGELCHLKNVYHSLYAAFVADEIASSAFFISQSIVGIGRYQYD